MKNSRFSRRSMAMGLVGVPFLAGGFWFAPSRTSPGRGPEDGHYVGKEVCAQCHDDRAAQHSGSNFDRSWRPVSSLPSQAFPLQVEEPGLVTRVENSGGEWVYRVRLAGRPWQTIPIHSVIGGSRFGLSFVLRATELESRPLPRAVLIEARYMLDASSKGLKLSPGFPVDPPASYETALGRVLSPTFAEKCLDCHGGVADPEIALQGGPRPVFGDTGVSCERCHGPGSRHLEALDKGGDDLQITNPAKLSNGDAMKLCGLCHSGFFPIPQPRPKDLMISSQATALANSTCFRQSGGGFSCVSCHDPHSNARADSPSYEATCRSCHDTSKRPGAKICPVDPASGCIPCHMPNVNLRGDFPVTDHWIRVFPQ